MEYKELKEMAKDFISNEDKKPYDRKNQKRLSVLKRKENNVFECERCHKKVNFLDLEFWLCDFDKDSYVCSSCYEEDLGEDL